MENTEIRLENKKIKQFNKIFPWYSGLSSDYLFYVAIDTLFLTVVKNFTATQIVSLTTISLLGGIILQPIIIRLIRRIGNTSSVRLGSLIVLISSFFITFGAGYISVVVGRLIGEIGFNLINMSNVILENNLELQNKPRDYVKIKSKATSIYAIATMIISFIASIMFNANNYLPMIFCIIFCFISFILSFYIVDYSPYDKIEREHKKTKKRVHYSKLILIIIVSYGIFYPIVNEAQNEGKLFIQQELLLNFDIETTALIIGAILCISRVIRVISNIALNKIYDKLKNKMMVLLSVLLASASLLMILGSFVNDSIIIKIVIMSIGYVIILFVRDPFKVYTQDLALKHTNKEEQQTILVTLELSRKLVRTIVSFGFSMILIDYPMIVVMVLLLILSVIEIAINIKLYRLILTSKGENN